MTPTTPIEILLVEDNEADARLTAESFKDSHIANIIHHTRDGQEALEYLDGRGTDEQIPDLILLDLDMPNMDGREFLDSIKAKERFRRIPVIVLTISENPADILQAYDLHANSYIVKPVEFDNFIKVIQAFENFWLTVVKLPKGDS